MTDQPQDQARQNGSQGKSNLEASQDKAKGGGGTGNGGGGGGGGGGSGTTTAQGQVAPRTDKTGQELKEMTLQQLYDHTLQQVDWANDPGLSLVDRKLLWPMVHFGRESPAIRGACGWMLVKELIVEAATRAKLDQLRSYANAFKQERPTVELKTAKAPSVAEAVRWGRWLTKFEQHPGGPVAKVIMPQKQFQDLITQEPVAQDFVTYIRQCDPLLHAKNGREVDSFLKLHGHKPPHQYKGKVPNVRSFHRFEGKALDTLEINYRAKLKPDRKDKPLVLILHSAVDETGAFHHDAKLTDVIDYPQNHTLMIEGARTLSEAGSKIPKIAKDHGQQGQIQQAMIAGHGNTQVIELAGDTSVEQEEKVDPDDPTKKIKQGKLKTTEEALWVGDTKSDAFFKTLFANMDPKARVVLNACLTNSNEISNSDLAVAKGQADLNVALLTKDPAKIAAAKSKLEKAAKDYINNNPSIVTDLQNKYPGRDVIGANASIDEVDLMDKGTGQLGIVSAKDPAVMGPKLDYIEKGIEPGGVLKAVAECWAKFPTQWEARVDARLKATDIDWRDTCIIKPIFKLIKGNYVNNLVMINKFVETASTISHMTSAAHCRVDKLKAAVPDQHIKDLFPPLMPASSWGSDMKHVPVVVFQVWLSKDASKLTELVDWLGQQFNCSDAEEFLDEATLKPHLKAALALPDSGNTRKGKLLLALWRVGNHQLDPEVKTYLTTQAGTAKQLPADALAVLGSYQGLDGDEVLYRIGAKARPGEATKPPTGTTAPSPADLPKNNADTDRDGQNDVLVTPQQGTAQIIVASLPVHAGPGNSHKVIGKLKQGNWVDVTGKTDKWLAVEYQFRLGYIAAAGTKIYGG